MPQTTGQRTLARGRLAHAPAGHADQSQLRLLLIDTDNPGPPEELHVAEAELTAAAPDGRSILFCAQQAPGQWDMWRLALDGSRKVEPFLATPKAELSPISAPPRKLFDLPEGILFGFGFSYDVTPDGQRFVMIEKDPLELRPLVRLGRPGVHDSVKCQLRLR